MNPTTDIPILLLVFGISLTLFHLVARRWPLPVALWLAVSVGVVLLLVTAITLKRPK